MRSLQANATGHCTEGYIEGFLFRRGDGAFFVGGSSVTGSAAGISFFSRRASRSRRTANAASSNELGFGEAGGSDFLFCERRGFVITKGMANKSAISMLSRHRLTKNSSRGLNCVNCASHTPTRRLPLYGFLHRAYFLLRALDNGVHFE